MDELGMIPSWAIAEAMRRSDERRRSCAAKTMAADERRQTAALRWRKRWERVASAFVSLRPTSPNDPAEA